MIEPLDVETLHNTTALLVSSKLSRKDYDDVRLAGLNYLEQRLRDSDLSKDDRKFLAKHIASSRKPAGKFVCLGSAKIITGNTRST
jgi:hypothetical protein